MAELPEALRGHRFTSAEARARGLSANQLRGSMVRRVHHGAYVDATFPDTLATQVSAAFSVLPADAVVVGTTALGMLGVIDADPPLQFATTRLHPVRRPGIQVRRVLEVPPQIGGVARPAYAFVDAARELDLVSLVAAGDQLVRRRRTTTAELDEVAEAARGRGCRLARHAAGLVRKDVDSPRETWVRLLTTLAGLPEPEVNVAIVAQGVRLGRPDLSWPLWRTAVEYEGDQHRSDRRQWDYDISRYEAFHAAGWTVLRVTSTGARDPRKVVLRVDRALRANGYTGRRPHFTAGWDALFR